MSLKELRNKQMKRVELDELPDTIEAMPTNWVEEKDKKGDVCLFVTFKIAEGNFTQKYTPYHYADLVKAFEALNLDGWTEPVEKGLILKMKKKNYAMGFARYIPVGVAQ